jgi:hypothetical protein
LMKEICDYGEFSQTTIWEIGIGYNESPEI